jgi:hypothetical protein
MDFVLKGIINSKNPAQEKRNAVKIRSGPAAVTEDESSMSWQADLSHW